MSGTQQLKAANVVVGNFCKNRSRVIENKIKCGEISLADSNIGLLCKCSTPIIFDADGIPQICHNTICTTYFNEKIVSITPNHILEIVRNNLSHFRNRKYLIDDIIITYNSILLKRLPTRAEDYFLASKFLIEFLYMKISPSDILDIIRSIVSSRCDKISAVHYNYLLCNDILRREDLLWETCCRDGYDIVQHTEAIESINFYTEWLFPGNFTFSIDNKNTLRTNSTHTAMTLFKVINKLELPEELILIIWELAICGMFI